MPPTTLDKLIASARTALIRAAREAPVVGSSAVLTIACSSGDRGCADPAGYAGAAGSSTGGATGAGGTSATGGTTASGGSAPIVYDTSCPDVDARTGPSLIYGFTMSGCCLPSGECGMAFVSGPYLPSPVGCYPYRSSLLPVVLSSLPAPQPCGIRDGGRDVGDQYDATADGDPGDAQDATDGEGG